MAEPKDGGPAFPTEPKYSIRKDGAQLCLAAQPGMSLRDYFAVAALPELIREWGPGLNHAEKVSEQAYTISDAMLAEREKRNGEALPHVRSPGV